MRKLILVLIMVGGGLVTLFFLLRDMPVSNANRKFVTTIWPAYVLSRPIVGENDRLILLTQNTSDPHNFSLSPRALSELADADFLIKIGSGSEPWLEKVVLDNSNLKIIDLSETVSGYLVNSKRYILDFQTPNTCSRQGGQWQECGPNECQMLGGEICPQVCGKPVCAAQELDPHYWLDPILAAKATAALGRILAESTGDVSYQDRAQIFAGNLMELSQIIHNQTKDYPKRSMVVQHPAFSYFSRRFLMPILAYFEPEPGAEPTVRDLQRVNQIMKSNRINTIFIEPGPTEAYLDNFARQYGYKLLVLDPMETGDDAPDYYRKITLSNLEKIVEYLKEINE